MCSQYGITFVEKYNNAVSHDMKFVVTRSALSSVALVLANDAGQSLWCFSGFVLEEKWPGYMVYKDMIINVCKRIIEA